MITLQKLIPPENFDVFDKVPELNDIWEIPELQEDARMGYQGYGRMKFEGETAGEIFGICEDGDIIGLIGWFQLENSLNLLRMWYYGIVPSKRGKHYGEEAIQVFLNYLSLHAPQECIFLTESVTLARSIAPRIIGHFKKMGFEEFDDPNYGSNAGCGKVQSLKIRIPGR